MSIPIQISHHFSVSLQCHNSSVNFSTCIFYFGQKDFMKVPILTLSSVLVKICQIPHLILQTTSFSSNFAWLLSIIKENFSVFFRSNVIWFAQNEPSNVQMFETFECSDRNSPNFSHFCNIKCVFFQIFCHSSVWWDISPLYFS